MRRADPGADRAARGGRRALRLLDQRGLASFKRAYGPLLASATDLPYNIIFKGGEPQKAWFGGGAQRLENRRAHFTG